MKAAILNGVNKDSVLYGSLIKELQDDDYIVQSFNLPETEVAGCLGCFGCWLKTPGICVIDDAGRDIVKAVVACDLTVIISPVTFGGYSYHVKKAVDRLIPILLPHFTKIGGEIHHPPRYRKHPSLLVLGVVPFEDGESEKVFKTMVERNAINFYPPAWQVRVLTEDRPADEVDKVIREILSQLEVSS